MGRETIGGYEIVQEMLRDGMTTVYRAYQPSLDRYVALKALRSADNADPETQERFRQEAHMIARLRHPNIVQVYDLIEQGEQLYLVMELVEGKSLRDRLGGPLDPQQALAIIAQVGAALDLAHANGIVHRNVKPNNVLLDAQGRVLLTDFGIARLLEASAEQTGEQVAPDYLSPEQVAGHAVGPAADMYALGVMAFEMLTGQLPFRGDTTLAVMRAHVQDPVPRASEVNRSLPPEVDVVLEHAMAKEPGERYHTAAQLAAELRHALGPASEPTRETRASTPEAVVPTPSLPVVSPADAAKRSRPTLTLALLAVALAVAAIALGLWALPSRAPVDASPTAAISVPPSDALAQAQNAQRAPTAVQPVSELAATDTPRAVSQSVQSPEPAVSVSPAATLAPSLQTPTASAGQTQQSEHAVFMAISRDGVNFGADYQLAGPQGMYVAAFGSPGGGMRIYTSSRHGGKLRLWSTTDYRNWVEQPLQTSISTVFADVIRLADGSYRLYYVPAAEVARVTEERPLRSATSPDGVVFRDEPGERLVAAGLVYPSVARVGGGWTLIASQLDRQGTVSRLSAFSRDGLEFALDEDVLVPSGATKITAYDEALHLFVPGPAVTSWNSRDGRRWQLDPGVRLRVSGGKPMLQIGIIKTDDGVYRAIYTLSG
ncbi:MAG: protein kinase [Chloroflexi bacterium]|nr:protein kinase [Chloroflexota bacterium]